MRIYDSRRHELTAALWLGSALQFFGGYLEEPSLDGSDEERLLARVGELACSR